MISESHKLKIKAFFLTSFIIFSIVLPNISLHLNVKAQAGLPLISVTAPQTVTAPETRFFNVSVWLESSDLISVSTYQVYLTMDDSIVSAGAAWVPTENSSWIFHGETYVPVPPVREDRDNNDLYESVILGSTLLVTNGMASVDVTNPVLLGIIELHVQNAGTTILNISGRNEYSGNYETFIFDPEGEEITVERQNGQVEIEGYMPTESSIITLEVNPSQTLVKQNVTFTGQIIPRIPNVNVQLEQRRKYMGGYLPWGIITTVKTNQTSHYRYVHAFQEAGTYKLKASWNGNETYLGNSTSLEMKVKEIARPIMFEMRYADKKQFLIGSYDVPVPTQPETINVTIKNVTDLYQWRTKIYYDSRYLEIDEDEIWFPADNALNLTGLEYNSTIFLGEDEQGDYLLCEAVITEAGNGYTGNATLFQFNVTGLIVTIGLPGVGGAPTIMSVMECMFKNSTGNDIFHKWGLVKVDSTTLFMEGSFHIYIAGMTTTEMKIVNPATGENEFRFFSRDVSVGTTFNVTIKVANATDLYGWLSTLTYNPELINVTRVMKPQGDSTYVFYNKESTVDYTLEEGSIRINNTSTDSEPFQGDGLLVIIEFQILVVEPPGNQTELTSSLTFEETRIFTGVSWQGVAGEDGLYWLTIEDGGGDQRSLLETYWPYLVGIVIVILVIFLVLRRLRKRQEVTY